MKIIYPALIIIFFSYYFAYPKNFLHDSYFWELPWEYNSEIVKLIKEDPESFIKFIKKDSCQINSYSILYVASILKLRELSDWTTQISDTSHDARLLKSMYFYRVLDSDEDYQNLLNLLNKSHFTDSWAMAVVTVLSYDEKIFRIFEREVKLADGVKAETISMNLSWLMYILNSDNQLYSNYLSLLEESSYKSKFVFETKYWLNKKALGKNIFSELEKNMRLKIINNLQDTSNSSSN